MVATCPRLSTIGCDDRGRKAALLGIVVASAAADKLCRLAVLLQLQKALEKVDKSKSH